MEFFAVILLGVVFAAFSASVAGSKGYNKCSWALAGLLFGPIGFLATLGLPDTKQRKYLRLLLEHYGVLPDSKVTETNDDESGADSQRRRILGGG